jgi:hypothetical protein
MGQNNNLKRRHLKNAFNKFKKGGTSGILVGCSFSFYTS